MSWGVKQIQGTKYDLRHLNSFRLPVPCGDHGHCLMVSFGAHVFTREFQVGDNPALIFMDGNKQRTFCVNRYAHSLHLPAAISQAIGGDAYNNGGRLVLDTILPGVPGPYLIAFSIRPQKAKRFEGRLDVRSAYRRNAMPVGMKKAKFTTVVHNSLLKRKIRWK